MAVEQVTLCRCDHCRKTGAEPYGIQLRPLVKAGEEVKPALLQESKDLCKKCYDRLANFVQRGLTPPTPRKAVEAAGK